MSNLNLPTYVYSKHCFNVVFMTLTLFSRRSMTNSTEEKDEQRCASKASTDRPRPRGRRCLADRPKNNKMPIWQIVIQQIVGDKSHVGKS